MADQLLIEFCSPTLAGMKTGSMFCASFKSREELDREVRRLNGVLCKKGLRAIPLRYRGQRALLYLYRPGRLQKDLRQGKAIELLKEAGYRFGEDGHCNADFCVAQLAKRIRTVKGGDFPHEVGLFLGYPPDDVDSFMHHRDTGCKCTGFWKVYNNAEQAKETFSRFRKCIEVYHRQLQKGKRMEDLIVDAAYLSGAKQKRKSKKQENSCL